MIAILATSKNWEKKTLEWTHTHGLTMQDEWGVDRKQVLLIFLSHI
jgi:hypothetical protein